MSTGSERVIIQRQDGEILADYHLDPGTYGIGRDFGNALTADSDYLSRQHATLTLTPDQCWIEDNQSTHGTFLNGTRLTEATALPRNQAAQIGDLFLTISTSTADQHAARLYVPGDMIGNGRYTLKQELGRGGGGVVWLARDEHLQQSVATKRLPPELANDTVALGDLISEVQKARLLSHPNIIRIHDFIKLPDELPFITMEYVDGTDLGSLRNQQDDGCFNWNRLEGLAVQMCEALHYAHEQKIIHRDLKPANMMISRDGNLKLADFGIAASISDKSPKSEMEGDASGTTVYMSPQQMRGQRPEPADDIYALGATLYDLITTRPPFYTGDIFQLVQDVPPPTISQRMADFKLENHLPPHVEQAIMQCLAKNPADRPASAKDLANLLHPGEAPPPPPPTPAPEEIEEMESILSEPIQTTQQFLKENLPQPITNWWRVADTRKRDYALFGILCGNLIILELIYSKLEYETFWHTLKANRFFLPW
jgi:serine/threonine protein kinase